MKKTIGLLVVTVLLGLLPSFTLAQPACSLESGHAYKTTQSNAVWYVSSDCKKRPIKNPDVFFSHFTSWNDVEITTPERLARISNHELGFLPWGRLRQFKNGSIVKTVDDPRVYLLVNDKRYPIEDEETFREFGYRFDQIEDVFSEVLSSRILSQTISSVVDYPGNLIFSIGNDTKLYLLERDNAGNFAKRHIRSFDDVKRDYRTDRIAMLPAGTIIYDSVRPPLAAGSDLRFSGNVAVVEAAPSAVHRTAIDPSLEDTQIETSQPIVLEQDTNLGTPTAPTNQPSTNSGSVFTAGHEFHSYLHQHGRTPSRDRDGGSFRIKCEFSHMNYDDPIVYPGQQDRSHLHMYFGNTTVQYGTTINALRSQGNATCHGGPLNRSGYWVPTLLTPRYDSSGNILHDSNNKRLANVVLPVGGVDATDVYYKAGVDNLQSIQPMPSGLRMISGNARATGAQDRRYFQWQCESRPIRSFEDYSQHIPACPIGDRVYMIIFFPNCWDGVNLDVPDHRSHMAYAGAYNWPTPGIVCPSSHPVALPSVSYIMKFKVTAENAGPDGTSRDWFLSSDMYDLDSNPGGYSIHGDWFMAWNEEVMQTLTQNCLNRGLHCADGELGNGWSLNGGAAVGSRSIPSVVNQGMIGPSRGLHEMTTMGGM